MKVWIDLANSPHVPLFEPVVARLRSLGHDVHLTTRDHAQTLPLAETAWGAVEVVGGRSPAGRVGKAHTIAARAAALRRIARRERPDVALSHGSYAQILAARSAGVPAVTMMDYEFQPANHLSFRLAQAVIVPSVFPSDALRRFGASASKVVRYEGFKEELYLAEVRPDATLLTGLGIDPNAIAAVMRPPPEGALYHRHANRRFEEVLEHLLEHAVQVVLLPRTADQARRYPRARVVVPSGTLDGPGLLATVDLTVGAGGTMTRESALLGTPTYTVFLAELAAVDAELIRLGKLVDLREGGSPSLERRHSTASSGNGRRASAILDVVIQVVEKTARSSRRQST
jgi:predicted glycosyltransferase